MATVKPLILVNGIPTGLPPTSKLEAADIQETTEKQFVTVEEKALIGTGGGMTTSTVVSIAAAMAIALG